MNTTTIHAKILEDLGPHFPTCSQLPMSAGSAFKTCLYSVQFSRTSLPPIEGPVISSFMHSCFLQLLHQETPRMIPKCKSVHVIPLFFKACSLDQVSNPYHLPQGTALWLAQLTAFPSIVSPLLTLTNNRAYFLSFKSNPTPAFLNLPTWVFLSGKHLLQTSSSRLWSHLRHFSGEPSLTL